MLRKIVVLMLKFLAACCEDFSVKRFKLSPMIPRSLLRGASLVAAAFFAVVAVIAAQPQAQIRLAPDSPQGRVSLGITVAKFIFASQGEALAIDYLPFRLTQSGSAQNWSTLKGVAGDIYAVALIDEADGKIKVVKPSKDDSLTAATFTSAFGSEVKPLFWVISARQKRSLTVRVYLRPAADITNLKVALVPPDNGKHIIEQPIEGASLVITP